MLQQRTWNMDSASQGPEDGSDVKKTAKVEVPESGGSDEGKQEVVAAAAAAGRQQQQAKPVLKKPDKLAPCPRCDSLDTKFCYYNNYNVNQPRHFCKNCQRYWTAGGTLRNVPVGAGRRKNKHGSLQARHGQVPAEQVAVRLEPSLQRPCHARSNPAAIPDRTCAAPLASSSSDPSSQEPRPVSSAHAQAARRHHIPEPQASMSSERGGGRMGDAEQWASPDPEGEAEGEGEAEKEECGTSSGAPGYSSEQEATAAQEVQSTSRDPVPHVVAGVVREVGVIDGAMWTAAAAAAAAPFGIFNGSWPFGYNVGWSGPPPPGPNTVCPPGGAAALWSAAPGPNGMWPGAMCWGSTLIPGVPWMSPAGWGGGWSMPPWAGDAAAAAAAAAAAMQASAAAAAAAAAATTVPATTPKASEYPTRFPIRPVLSKHPRDRLELDRVESPLWVPKMVRLEDSPRSSVWTAVGPAVDSASNFKAFLPVATSVNTDDDSKASSKRVGSS